MKHSLLASDSRDTYPPITDRQREAHSDMKREAKRLTALAFLLLAHSRVAASQEHSPPLNFGMSGALSGPVSELGQQMKIGLQLAFDESNRAGGIHGTPIALTALDDRYEPNQTIANMRQLLADESILGIVGNVGTPTAVAALPLTIEAKTLFYGAFTGAGVLRTVPPEPVVFNVRAGYAEEVGAMIEALIGSAKLTPKEIAFFTQRDAYGDSGFSAGMRKFAEMKFGEHLQVHQVRYERNTLAVEDAAADILELASPPKAIIMIGTYAPTAKFIHLLTQAGFRPAYLTVSFVGTEKLAEQMADLSVPVVVTQVLPNFRGPLPAAKAYRLAIGSATQGTYASFEGYVAGRILVEALRRPPAIKTRADVLKALENLGTIDPGIGVPITLSPADHQALYQVWPTIVRRGGVHPMDWDEIDELLAPPAPPGERKP